MENVTAAPTKAAVRINIALAHATTPVAMATSATTVLQTVPRVNTVAVAVEPVLDHVRAAQTSPHTRHTPARAPSTRTIAAGDATRHTSTVVASATAAPTSHAAQISIARVPATTRAATAISATAAQPTAPQVNIVAAAAVRVRARVLAALIDHRTRTIPVRARSTRIIAAGDATPHTTTVAASVIAVPISHAAQISTVRAHVTTRVATATSVIAALLTALQVSIAAAAAVRAAATARGVQMPLQMRHTPARAQSIQTIAVGNATHCTIIVAASAIAALTKVVARISIVQAGAITRQTATSATIARPIVPEVIIVAAAAVQMLVTVSAVQMHPQAPTIRVRAQSTQTTAAGVATTPTITAAASATAAQTRAVAQINTARARAVIRVGIAIDATIVLQTVTRVYTVAVAVVRVLDIVRAAQTSHRTRTIPVRAR